MGVLTVITFEPVGRGASAVCEQCGRTFFGSPSVVRNRRWCSWECRTAEPRDWRSNERIAWRCETCGLERQQQPSEMYRRFCSLVCRNARWAEGRKRRVTVACGFCGKEYEKRPSEIAEGRGKFCSRRCSNLGRPLNGRPSKIATAAIRSFRRQHPEVATVEELRVGRYSIDLAVTDLRLAVELDGCYWHSLPAAQVRDQHKDKALAERGWRVVRITIIRESTAESLAAAIAEAVSATPPTEAVHVEALSA